MLNKSIQLIFGHEGGYQALPTDTGNYYKGKLIGTKYGVAAPTLAKWLGRDVTRDDMLSLDLTTATKIYKQWYADVIKYSELPNGLNYCVLDFAINSGNQTAIKHLQRVLNVKVDGIMGFVTLHAAQKADTVKTINALSDARLAYLKRLKQWAHFSSGWARRVSEVRKNASALASNKHTTIEACQPMPDDGDAKEPILTKENIAWAGGLLGTLGANFAQSQPVQWALALVIIGSFMLLAYSLIQKRVKL